MKGGLKPKERILETASKLFYEQGYNSTGINQIIDDSKVARASLYQHFGSKEELGVQYIKKVSDDWFESLESFLRQKKDPKGKVLAIFDFLEKNMLLNDYRGCRFLNMLAEIPNTNLIIYRGIQSHKAKLRELFNISIREHFKDQQNQFDNVGDIVYLLFESAITESKVYKDCWPIKTAKKAVKEHLTR